MTHCTGLDVSLDPPPAVLHSVNHLLLFTSSAAGLKSNHVARNEILPPPYIQSAFFSITGLCATPDLHLSSQLTLVLITPTHGRTARLS